MRTLALGILVLTLSGCGSLTPEESERWNAALDAMSSALMQVGNQMEAEEWRRWQVQQSMPRQAICHNHGSYLSCTSY
jgi:uncharacterized protein YceK